MDLKEFNNLSNQILNDDSLTEQQKEEKIIQFVDLIRFIKCYNSSINTSECKFRGKINVIVDGGKEKGILFCDLNSLHSTITYKQLVSEAKKNHGRAKELWLVFVRERETIDAGQALEFIQQENMSYFFDKLFLFDFFREKIYSLN